MALGVCGESGLRDLGGENVRVGRLTGGVIREELELDVDITEAFRLKSTRPCGRAGWTWVSVMDIKSYEELNFEPV